MFKKVILTTMLSLLSLSALTFKEEIKQDKFLSNGFAGFIKHQNHNYLVSVGISEIENSTIQAKINALKEAKILAQSKLMKFIHNVEIKTKNDLTSKIVIEKNGKNISQKIDESYIEIIKEKGSGILKNIIDIGKWQESDEYLYALGVKLDE